MSRPVRRIVRGLVVLGLTAGVLATAGPAGAATPTPDPRGGRLTAPAGATRPSGTAAGSLAAATISDVTVEAVNELPPIPAGGSWTYTVKVINNAATAYSALALDIYQSWPDQIPADAVGYSLARDGGTATPVSLTAQYLPDPNVTVLTGSSATFSLASGASTTFTVTVTPGSSASFGRIYLDEAVKSGADSTTPKARFGFRWVDDFASEAFVDKAYFDFLGRSPDRGGLTYWAGLVRGGLVRGELAFAFARQPEYLDTLVNGFYLSTLGRTGDPGGVAYWSGLIRDRKLTEAQVAAYFYASDEFYRTAGSDPAWVDELYQRILGRPADTAGRDYWVGVTAQQGRHAVAYTFYQSLESRRVRVSNLYAALLYRLPDAGGRDYWSDVVLQRGDLALAAFLAGSDEYLALSQDLRA